MGEEDVAISFDDAGHVDGIVLSELAKMHMASATLNPLTAANVRRLSIQFGKSEATLRRVYSTLCNNLRYPTDAKMVDFEEVDFEDDGGSVELEAAAESSAPPLRRTYTPMTGRV